MENGKQLHWPKIPGYVTRTLPRMYMSTRSESTVSSSSILIVILMLSMHRIHLNWYGPYSLHFQDLSVHLRALNQIVNQYYMVVNLVP